MPAVVRVGDMCTGHGCWPPRASVSGSANVFINGVGAVCVGDAWAAHTCKEIPETHASVQSSGSGTVRVNGKALARTGDAIGCGSLCAGGSANVFAG